MTGASVFFPNPWQAYNFADAWNNTNNSPLCSQFREAKQKNPLTKRLSRLGSTRPVPKTQKSSNVSREASGDQQVLVSWVGSFRPKETNSQTSSGWRSRFLIRYLIANSIALLVTAKASKADTCTIVGKEGLSGESATAKRFYVDVSGALFIGCSMISCCIWKSLLGSRLNRCQFMYPTDLINFIAS